MIVTPDKCDVSSLVPCDVKFLPSQISSAIEILCFVVK